MVLQAVGIILVRALGLHRHRHIFAFSELGKARHSLELVLLLLGVLTHVEHGTHFTGPFARGGKIGGRILADSGGTLAPVDVYRQNQNFLPPLGTDKRSPVTSVSLTSYALDTASCGQGGKRSRSRWVKRNFRASVAIVGLHIDDKRKPAFGITECGQEVDKLSWWVRVFRVLEHRGD